MSSTAQGQTLASSTARVHAQLMGSLRSTRVPGPFPAEVDGSQPVLLPGVIPAQEQGFASPLRFLREIPLCSVLQAAEGPWMSHRHPHHHLGCHHCSELVTAQTGFPLSPAPGGASCPRPLMKLLTRIDNSSDQGAQIGIYLQQNLVLLTLCCSGPCS